MSKHVYLYILHYLLWFMTYITFYLRLYITIGKNTNVGTGGPLLLQSSKG